MDEYPIAEYPGQALVISMEDMPLGSERPGGRRDRVRLVALLERRGFRVTSLVDKAAGEIQDVLSQTERSTNHGGSFLCVIMAHCGGGENTYIIAADGERINLNEDVFSRFKASRCKGLQQKPKVFLINCCRGSERMQFRSARSDRDDVPDAPLNIGGNLPRDVATDLLIAYSTLPDYMSFRDRKRGSWFMSAFIDVFESYGDSMHVSDMVTKTNQKILDEIARRREVGQAVEKVERGIKGHIYWRTPRWAHLLASRATASAPPGPRAPAPTPSPRAAKEELRELAGYSEERQLRAAAYLGLERAIEALVAGAPAGPAAALLAADSVGDTPLHHAAYAGQAGAARALLRLAPSPAALLAERSNSGSTPREYAEYLAGRGWTSQEKTTAVLEVLREFGG